MYIELGEDNGVRAVCPNGHEVIINPPSMALGFWYCRGCEEWIIGKQWKVLEWFMPSRSRRVQKELPEGHKPVIA
jgi:hypothetical protein